MDSAKYEIVTPEYGIPRNISARTQHIEEYGIWWNMEFRQIGKRSSVNRDSEENRKSSSDSTEFDIPSGGIQWNSA